MNFLTKEPINKGWSNDKKYCITDKNGTQYLLRVSDLAEHDKKQSEFNIRLKFPTTIKKEFMYLKIHKKPKNGFAIHQYWKMRSLLHK